MNRALPRAMRPSRCECDIAIRYPQREAARLAAKRKSHPALLATLRCFSAQQLTYDLYEEDEPCDKPLVFAFEGTALNEEKSGRVFPSPDEAAAFAKTVCPPAVWVETADGKTVEDVLLRHYQDGSVAVLGLTAKEHGKLRLMRRGGEPAPFELPARGVFRFEGKASVRAVADTRCDSPAFPPTLPSQSLSAHAIRIGWRSERTTWRESRSNIRLRPRGSCCAIIPCRAR